jgi:hypothetical protein
MKLWAPLAAGAVIVLAYALFYTLSAVETQGATSLGLANAAGLVAVLVGLDAADMIQRRRAPPVNAPESRNP